MESIKGLIELEYNNAVIHIYKDRIVGVSPINSDSCYVLIDHPTINKVLYPGSADVFIRDVLGIKP